jgi:SpoVK/Ycf46/Vps4 family AAA+-type ATPase
MKKYDKIVQMDSDYRPISDITVLNKLPPGIYEVNATNSGEIFFSKIQTNHDELIDLPSKEYDQVIREIGLFMIPESRALFAKHGFVYKRSTLLHGAPGTGKTCIVNRIAHNVVADGGIALFSPNPQLLEETFKIFEAIQPETRIMVIFEELDQLMQRYESELLNILDGEIQKSNIIYIATTNYIDKIPTRIRRPGRFSSVVQVGFPTDETRRFYLKRKLGEGVIDIDHWISKTKGFSIDELKETVLSVLCLNADIDVICARVLENKKSKDRDPEKYEEDEEEWDDPFETKNNKGKRRR